MWRHRPLEEYLVFVEIRAAHTSFSPFTLGAIVKYEKPISNETAFKNWLLNAGTVHNTPDGLQNLLEPLNDVNM